MKCGATDLARMPASGRGRLYSFSEIHRQVTCDHIPPYTVCLVDLDEGPRIMANCTKSSSQGPLRCGAPVELRWRKLDGGEWLPTFEVASNELIDLGGHDKGGTEQ